MFDALRQSLNATAVSSFALYILVAAIVFALFQFIYTRMTPHREFELIRANNPAAAIATSGSVARRRPWAASSSERLSALAR